MRIKFRSRWAREDLKAAICSAIDDLAIDNVEYLSGVNLYFCCEDENFEKFTLVNEEGLAIQRTFFQENPPRKPRKPKRKPATVHSLSEFRDRKKKQ